MKNLPVYIIAMALALYIMVMFTEPAYFAIFLGLVAVCIFELLAAVYLRQSIRLSLKGPETLIHNGDMVPVTLHIRNQGFFPANHLRVHVKYSNRLDGPAASQWVCTYADGKCDAFVTFHVESAYCGVLHVEVDRFKAGSFLRLWGFTKKCNRILDVPVFPELFPVDFEISAKIRDFIGESDTYSKEKSGDDPSEVFDIRSFRPGDRLQRIHWKLTARQDELMVKEFSRPVGYPVVVFFNFSKQSQMPSMLEAMSKVITAGLSVSAGLARAKCWHYIAWCRQDMTIERHAIESEEDVYACMGRLLYAHAHLPIADARHFYGQTWGFESFCTFLSVNTDLTIEKDGEIYEQKGLDRDTLSGKNFIL